MMGVGEAGVEDMGLPVNRVWFSDALDRLALSKASRRTC